MFAHHSSVVKLTKGALLDTSQALFLPVLFVQKWNEESWTFCFHISFGCKNMIKELTFSHLAVTASFPRLQITKAQVESRPLSYSPIFTIKPSHKHGVPPVMEKKEDLFWTCEDLLLKYKQKWWFSFTSWTLVMQRGDQRGGALVLLYQWASPPGMAEDS